MQAMIITAFRDVEGLRRTLSALSRYALCFVHADAKGEITEAQVRELDALENVRAVRRYRVNWGSIDHLKALLLLCNMALEDSRVTHLHLMSGQDFPTLPHAEFLARFEGDPRVHIQMERLSDHPELEHRYRHYHAMHLVDYRDPDDRVQTLVGRIDRFQDMLHVRRGLDLRYKGFVWMTLPREAARYALTEKRCRRLLRKLRWTYIPEEFFFQNALADAGFALTGDALRFHLWDEPERGLPALLDERDLPGIDASGYVMARKVNPGTPLYDILERRWLS